MFCFTTPFCKNVRTKIKSGLVGLLACSSDIFQGHLDRRAKILHLYQANSISYFLPYRFAYVLHYLALLKLKLFFIISILKMNVILSRYNSWGRACFAGAERRGRLGLTSVAWNAIPFAISLPLFHLLFALAKKVNYPWVKISERRYKCKYILTLNCTVNSKNLLQSPKWHFSPGPFWSQCGELWRRYEKSVQSISEPFKGALSR